MKFKLYWTDGKTEVIEGKNAADAFNNAGYGLGAMKALDYYEKFKLSDTQRAQIKAVKKEIAREKRYVPRGQGDGINQHLKFRHLSWIIDQIKADKDMTSELRGRGIYV